MEMLLIFPLLLVAGSHAFFKLAGPYEATLELLTECKNVGKGQIRHDLRIRKVNSTTRLLQGEANYTIAIDDNLSYELSSEKWSSGGWGKNAFYFKGDIFCTSYLDNVFEVFDAFLKALGVATRCPVPAGFYRMESGMGLIFKNLKNFPSLPYGRYRTTVNMSMGGELVGCVQMIVNIEEIASNYMFG